MCKLLTYLHFFISNQHLYAITAIIANIPNKYKVITIFKNVYNLKYSTTGMTTGAWFGAHNIKGTPANWNGNPSTASFASPPPAGEYCLMVSTGGLQVWRPCSYTDITVVYGAICYKQGMTYRITLRILTISYNISNMIWYWCKRLKYREQMQDFLQYFLK